MLKGSVSIMLLPFSVFLAARYSSASTTRFPHVGGLSGRPGPQGQAIA